MLRRLVAVLAAAAVAVVLQAQPASAKLPYFSVEPQPENPAPGVAAQLVVHFFDDQARQAPSTWQGPAVINDLLCLFPAGHVITGRAGCPGGRPVTVRRVDAATYTGSFSLPTGGRWLLVTFPATPRPLPAGYPDEIAIGANPVGRHAARYTVAGIWFALALLALLAVAAFMAERRARRVRHG